LVQERFEGPLIAWLFQICTKLEALIHLSIIIECAQGQATDNVNSATTVGVIINDDPSWWRQDHDRQPADARRHR
jgi:hypothetical protein